MNIPVSTDDIKIDPVVKVRRNRKKALLCSARTLYLNCPHILSFPDDYPTLA